VNREERVARWWRQFYLQGDAHALYHHLTEMSEAAADPLSINPETWESLLCRLETKTQELLEMEHDHEGGKRWQAQARAWRKLSDS